MNLEDTPALEFKLLALAALLPIAVATWVRVYLAYSVC